MMRRSPGKAVAAALGAVALLLAPATAPAQYRGHHGGGWDRGGGFDYHGGGGPDDRRGGPRERDDGRGGYGDGHGYGYRRGRGDLRGRHVRCRDAGTGSTIIGAIAGGLLGNSIAGYGDRAAGTIIGAGGGALAGRLIGRDC